MAWAHVQSVSQRVASGANAKAYASSVTAGSLLVVGIGLETDSATISSVTGGGTWIAIGTLQVLSGFGATQVYYLKNAGGGATTVTVTPSTGPSVISIVEYSGLDTTAPFDVTLSAQGTSGSAASGSQALAVTGELVFGLVFANRTLTVGSGYTQRQNDSSNQVMLSEDKVGGASENVTATLGSSGFWIATLVGFREPFSAGPRARSLTMTGFG